MGGPINPIEGIDGNRGPEERGRGQTPTYRKTLQGEVTRVRKRARHPAEPHRLDATVGDQEYDEIVVRVTRGDVDDAAGKRVVITFEH